MKTKLHLILLSILFVSLGVNATNAGFAVEDDDIVMKGDFPIAGTRSLTTGPFSANIADDVLSVYANVVVGTVTVTVVKDAQTYYSTTVNVTTRGQIVSYPLDGLDAGIYLLEIRNSQGGYLYGELTIIE